MESTLIIDAAASAAAAVILAAAASVIQISKTTTSAIAMMAIDTTKNLNKGNSKNGRYLCVGSLHSPQISFWPKVDKKVMILNFFTLQHLVESASMNW